MFEFDCKNLKDHQDRTRSNAEAEINGDDGICKSREAAANAKFSVAEYLLSRRNIRLPCALAADHGDVDWESIMLYSSGAV